MAINAIQGTKVKMREARSGFSKGVGGNSREREKLSASMNNERVSALQKADTIIDSLEESYRKSARLLRAMDNILSRL
jgi:hypothetical protein